MSPNSLSLSGLRSEACSGFLGGEGLANGKRMCAATLSRCSVVLAVAYDVALQIHEKKGVLRKKQKCPEKKRDKWRVSVIERH